MTAAAGMAAAPPPAWGAQGLDLEPIVVTRGVGRRGPHPASDVLTREDIERRAFSSPEDVLSALGADLQTRGRSGIKSDVTLNASTFQQVLILVNGVPVKDTQTSHHDLDLFFNIEDIERVELIPAASAVKYGPGGMGGAVNFVLKEPAYPEAAKNSLSVAGGSDTTFEASGRVHFSGLGGHHTLSAGHGQSDGSRYDTDHRTETFFYSGTWGGAGDTTTRGAATNFSLNAGYNEKEFGAYDFYTPHRGFPSKEWTNTSFVDLRGRSGNDAWTFEPRAFWRRHHDKFALNVENIALYLNHHRTDTYAGGVTITRHFDEWDLSLGLDHGEERITSRNLGDHDRGHWDVYLDPRFELSDRTVLNITLRLDDYTSFGSEMTGGVTLTHAYAGHADVYASFGRTMRVPTFTELYYLDPTTAGNANLEPEHAINLETGWRKKVAPDVDVSLSVFGRREDDTIDFTKLTPADARFVARNISRAHSWGLNAFAAWQATDTAGLDLRYTYCDKDLDDNGLLYKYGLSYAKHMVRLGFDWDPAFGHNRCDVIMKKKPGRRAWVVVNDRFTLPLSGGWRLFAEVYNLFNQEYQEIDGIPEQGRLFKLGLDLSW